MVASDLPFGRRAALRVAALAATIAVILTAAPAAVADPTLTSFDVPTLDADPHGIVVGPDGAVWFTERVAGKIGRLHGGAITEFDLPDPGSQPTGITVGGDGALWFTLPGSNQIGRMTTDGVFEGHDIAAAASSPTGIATAPDGTVWFTLRGTHRIGWIDDAGMHEVTPGGSVQPTGIAAGPDGGMWYTEQRSNRVGRVDLATLTVTRFLLPAASAGPTAIAPGGDGAMWFTLRGSNQIGRIATDGGITTYAIPTDAAFPSSIAPAGADWMWFTENGADQVARIALADGMVEEFPTEPGAGPSGVVAGGTGAWFAEGALNRITHLGMSGEADLVAPTIDLWSPAPGAWTVKGSGALSAGFACADEGGSLLASCEGTVEDDAPVPDGTLGRHTLSVRAEDGAGNVADASAPYLVFGSAWGSALGDEPARAGKLLWLALRMDLGRRAPSPVAGATTQVVDCDTGDAVGTSEPAEIHAKVGPRGHFLWVWWDTERGWAGQCRTLTLGFSADRWSGADATFGPVTFDRHHCWWCWWWRD